MSNSLEPDQARPFGGSILGPSCLQNLSADILEGKELIALILLDLYQNIWERSGPLVECLTGDRRAGGSSLIGVTALCP